MQKKNVIDMEKDKKYPQLEEENGSCMLVSEPAVALEEQYVLPLPDDVDYAHVENGTLQVSSDIEAEILEVDRGETVSMSEFKTMFSQWL